MTARRIGRRSGWLLAVAALAIGSSLALGDAGPWNLPPVAAAVVPPGPEAAAATPAHGFVSLSDAATSSVVGGPVTAATDVGVGSWPRIALDPPAGAAPTAASGASSGVPKPTAKATPNATATGSPSHVTGSGVWWSVYHGTSHVWMPTLGISQHVYLFACSRSTDPANLVYRWGCAGTNNVYLLGHAYGVFLALHDAYANGKLRKGMPVVYADAAGHVRLYRVTTWRIVSPADAGWAIASQPVPSMTLQTCIGADGSQRLNVRLVAAST